MNLNKVKREYKKARRTMYGQAPDMRGVTSLAQVTKRSEGPVVLITKELHGQITFYLGGRPVTIHGKTAVNKAGRKDKEPEIYRAKIELLRKVIFEAFVHLKSKDEAQFMSREFLNHEDDDNDYGSSIMIRVPEFQNKHEFCTFEIASCHFKIRMNPNRQELIRHLKFMIKTIDLHMFDYEQAYQVWKGQ
ncbi:hypothetical protein OBP_297 [Pseudomonas phage OBP]|uniref:hypothetical protein n=1 Tax=Pseudomonas phage OBP TaxID=1124849 RepID=UPI000240D644|nr:hypothetical protein OBP_297 [Pseudomonas phage OBP]AEV89734.1 hypothetical protein OBP_297 [Pseudomonas phage OBP]